jgi:hypothetical protein
VGPALPAEPVCTRLHGQLREALVYQPVSRYCTFQWYEMAIFLGLALALAAFCVWWCEPGSVESG